MTGKCLDIKTKSSTKICMHNIIAVMEKVHWQKRPEGNQ